MSRPPRLLAVLERERLARFALEETGRTLEELAGDGDQAPAMEAEAFEARRAEQLARLAELARRLSGDRESFT